MKVVIQNLQKRKGLSTDLVRRFNPDILLVQEINLSSAELNFQAHHTSRRGFGTAICSRVGSLSNIRLVTSPHAEFGGFIYKKTTVATCSSVGLELVSFHGYNGQPLKNDTKLVEHVVAVLAVLGTGPALFAGDFNTWSDAHLEAVKTEMAGAGFELACSWPYPNRDIPLDHAFVRGIHLQGVTLFSCDSDHQGALLEICLATT